MSDYPPALGAIAESMNADQIVQMAETIARLQRENDALRALSLKAFTIVEWAAGEGFILPYPHLDADDMLLEMVDALKVEDSEDARRQLQLPNRAEPGQQQGGGERVE